MKRTVQDRCYRYGALDRPVPPKRCKAMLWASIATTGAILVALWLMGCSVIRGSNVVHTDTIVGLRVQTTGQQGTPDVSFGLIRSSTILSPTNETRSIAFGTDAEHMGWNRSKVFNRVTFGLTNWPAGGPTNFWDGFNQ